ncbi:hypothetical protein V8F20_006589 [Naviculisporaceae sp. PSN 640]
MSSSSHRTSWNQLPPDIHDLILKAVLEDRASFNLAALAIVSKEWQSVIEKHNFAHVKLTHSRLLDFDAITRRNRAHVRKIWLCLELEGYDCKTCMRRPQVDEYPTRGELRSAASLKYLLRVLSTWEPATTAGGGLVLDLTVHSPSDSEHRFPYLTFEPDMSCAQELPDWLMDHGTDAARGGGRRQQQSSVVLQPEKPHDPSHGWINGRRKHPPSQLDINMLFEDFYLDSMEKEWWDDLPGEIPVVTGVVIRQQNRRQWDPKGLGLLFRRFPRLETLHYEPWRERCKSVQPWTDRFYRSLIESLGSSQLRRLVLFENFNPEYPCRERWMRDPIRVPAPSVVEEVSRLSLNLEQLSASFLIDAEYFFNACQHSWVWSRLRFLSLTTRLMTPECRVDMDPTTLENLLLRAAIVARQMPRLETMEIWNGDTGFAMLFKYHRTTHDCRAMLVRRGTWGEFTPLESRVIQAWKATAYDSHDCLGFSVVDEPLPAAQSASIKSHGDAIHYLQLQNEVIRPTSLRQIRIEGMVQA